ncbi:phage tail protein [Variovorax boronicumulans]|uniref:phage tail protein n=1 Tax=Variovorax boronicumulans TaxID=436515 RepID=UPI0012E4FA89|nr:phage tail protein [Variovorax boronicumulans]GER21449.1 hypothetical protein VCH24_65010 [Variovorax boronicumulans]
MSTQQILGVVGGVVGAFFGYPQLGFVVGSLVGGLLTPGEKTEGPRVDDLKVQVSTYGAGIPILYGTERVGGNVVWSTDKIEMEETTGGKGGAPEQTTYRYFVHMGIVLCETPRDGSEVSIVQIFQDGKLIYDAHSGIPVGSALASSENPHAYFVLYQGHADQLPDPGEEAWMGGPGSVPAYRGVVRIRMNAVECPGGRVPQFSFVISTSTVIQEENLTYSEVPIVGDGNDVWAVVRQDAVWHFVQVGSDYSGDYSLVLYNVGAGYATQARTMVRTDVHYGYAAIPLSGDGIPMAVRTWREASGGVGSVHYVDRYDLELGVRSQIFSYTPGTAANVLAPVTGGYDESSGRFALRGGGADRESRITLLFGGTEVLTPPIPGTAGPVTIKDSIAYALSVDVGVLKLTSYDAIDGSLLDANVGPAYFDAGGSIEWAALHPVSGGVYVWVRQNSSYNLYLVSSGAGWTLVSSSFNTTGAEKLGNHATTFFASPLIGIIGPSAKQGGMHRYNLIRFQAINTSDVKVKDIIAEQCERAGEFRFDVSDIPDADVVHGYKLQNPANARANIDPLLTAFASYMVDEDGVIKFKKYEDIASVASIAYDELGQAEAGSEPADAMPLNRAQEVDLPRSVSVSYLEPLRDYQTASEKEVRQITEANEDLIVELPLATTSDHAKQVAQTILFDRWRAQNTRSCKVSRKYAFLSPGDGITVEYPRGTWRLWRITSMTDTGALCELNVEPGDAELYTQTAVGATGYVPQEVAPLAPPTRLQLLDIPILRDQDNNAGIYAALDNYGPGWSGAELLVGYDDASLASRGTVSTDAPIGFAETVLGAAPSSFVDESSVFTVSIGNNDFTSVTRDVLLANGGEFWACGAPGRWEIGASAVGDSLGSGRYILSRHLRGLFGTEANAAMHQVGDVFVLLRIAGMLRPSMGVGDIGQAQQYRAVSKGRSLNSAASQTYTNTGEGLMPLSPVNLRRSNTNDLSVDRRSRLAMNNSTGALPLGEAVEAWSWEFYTAGDFMTRLGTALTSTATVTSAQITAAGATPSGTLYVRVAQVSDSVGRGHELQATI